MAKRKKIRTRGKLQLSKYFQNLEEGDRVSVTKEQSIASVFPKRIQGKTGMIETKRGRSYVVKLNDKSKEKRFIIEGIHLKKLKS